MIPRIKSIKPLVDYELHVTFDDGKSVIYDVKEDMRDIPSYRDLSTICGLFEQMQLDASRTCVYWNENIDLPSDAIYEYGVAAPDDPADECFSHVGKTSPTWDSIEEVEPDEFDLQMIRETKNDPECSIFLPANEALERLERWNDDAAPDDLAAIESARAEYARGETVNHNDINWD